MRVNERKMHTALLYLSILPGLAQGLAVGTQAGSSGSGSNAMPSVATTASGFVTSATAAFPTGTSAATSPAGSSMAVNFDCGTHIGHASDHFIDTVHGLHHGQYPNGSAYDGPVATGPNNTASSSTSSSTTKRSPLLRRLFARQSNSGSAAAASNSGSSSNTPAAGAISVAVYLHVVTTKAHANMVSPSQMSQQLTALNNAYNAHGVTFHLGNTSWTINDAWAVGGNDTVDVAMKSALRQGTYKDLNLYFQSDTAGGNLGICTLPTNIGANPAPSVYVRDGCNIALGTVPQGPIYGYNMGKTAVHETGHWLGLLHTFEGYTCGGSGDYIGDTPAEAQSTNGCPSNPQKNTCPGRAGSDPIHNYMDYSTDACYTSFTGDQQGRIHSLWPQYRQGK